MLAASPRRTNPSAKPRIATSGVSNLFAYVLLVESAGRAITQVKRRRRNRVAT